MIMAEMASLWSYEQNHEMEQLGQKLICTNLELQKLRAEAMEEKRKNKDYINQLIQLLKHAIDERDEARNQFQKLLNNTTPTTAAAAVFQSDSPQIKPGRANSSITESNSLSENYNFDSVSSPDFSTMNQEIDQASLIVDNLAKGAVLPKKGEFLQTVLQAAPLLQTLLVAGPLPRWRNPPLFQPSQIPMLSFGAMDSNDYTPLAKRQRFV